jgi:hypothetical protein
MRGGAFSPGDPENTPRDAAHAPVAGARDPRHPPRGPRDPARGPRHPARVLVTGRASRATRRLRLVTFGTYPTRAANALRYPANEPR